VSAFLADDLAVRDVGVIRYKSYPAARYEVPVPHRARAITIQAPSVAAYIAHGLGELVLRVCDIDPSQRDIACFRCNADPQQSDCASRRQRLL
jgi:hypothetical protein